MKLRRSISLQRKQSMTGYLFLAPIIIGLLLIFLPALVRAFIYSINIISINGGKVALKYIGFKTYNELLFVNPSSSFFVTSLTQALTEIPIIIVFSFFIANVLNQKFIGRGIARALFFLPVIMAAGVVSLLDSGDLLSQMYSEGTKLETGIEASGLNYDTLKTMLMQSEIGSSLVNLVLGAVDSLYTVVTSSGVQILVFLSGLQSISPSLYEAAYVEGASGWVSFWKISFPMITPLIMVNVVYTLIASFTSSNNAAMRQIRVYLYENLQYHMAMALSLVYILIVAIILVLVYFIINKLLRYSHD